MIPLFIIFVFFFGLFSTFFFIYFDISCFTYLSLSLSVFCLFVIIYFANNMNLIKIGNVVTRIIFNTFITKFKKSCTLCLTKMVDTYLVSVTLLRTLYVLRKNLHTRVKKRARFFFAI